MSQGPHVIFSPMSDYGKVVKLRYDKGRYFVTEGSTRDGWLGGQKIVRRGKGIPHNLPDGQVVWLDEMHRTLSASDVVSMKPYKEPKPRVKKETVVVLETTPRGRLSGLAERACA